MLKIGIPLFLFSILLSRVAILNSQSPNLQSPISHSLTSHSFLFSLPLTLPSKFFSQSFFQSYCHTLHSRERSHFRKLAANGHSTHLFCKNFLSSVRIVGVVSTVSLVSLVSVVSVVSVVSLVRGVSVWGKIFSGGRAK
jgi:hypothetical protein